VLWLYLRDRRDLFAQRLRVLHLAPEPWLERRLPARPDLDYLSGDLAPEAAMTVVDLERLPFAGDAFDRVLCIHVLEHVADDGAALRELARVLAPGSEAIVMVPLLGTRTDEDPAAPTEERLRRFGQADHVRLYGTDLRDRIAAAGLQARVVHMGRAAHARAGVPPPARPGRRRPRRHELDRRLPGGQAGAPAAELTAQPSVCTSSARTSSRETSRFSAQSRVTASTKPIHPRTAKRIAGVRSPPCALPRGSRRPEETRIA